MREQLARWWNSLFGGPKENATVDPSGIADLQAAPPRPFASFRNPFGVEKDPRRIVVITAQAFDAWARERGFARRQDETPSEFVQRLKAASRQRQDARALFGPIDGPSDRLTMAYDRIVFGRGVAQQRDLDAAQQIWQHMTQTRVPQPAAVG